MANLVQFHFHWGRHDQNGSEHTINDRHYPLEVLYLLFSFFIISSAPVHGKRKRKTRECLRCFAGAIVLLISIDS
jgi:hypothetical protein